MKRPISLLAACALVASPSLAAAQKMNPQKMQQISEVVFKNYPPRALANGEQGAVFFTVTLDKDAHPTSCQVTHGSGHPLLDEETCDLIVKHAVFNSVKDAKGRTTKSTHEGVVNWTIPGMAPVPINPIPLTAQTAPEKRICRNTVKSGTIAGVQRTCMTQTEWARQDADNSRTWQDVRNQGFTTGENMCMGTACNANSDPVGIRQGNPSLTAPQH